MSRLTDFETAALKAIFETTSWVGDPNIGLSSIEVIDREDTGVGFYAKILQRTLDFRLANPHPQQPPTIVVKHPKLTHDGIVTLWVTSSGFVEGLEATSFTSEEWPDGEVKEFDFQMD